LGRPTEKSVVATDLSVKAIDKSISRTVFVRLEHKPNTTHFVFRCMVFLERYLWKKPVQWPAGSNKLPGVYDQFLSLNLRDHDVD
jgi:hypothetical protein